MKPSRILLVPLYPCVERDSLHQPDCVTLNATKLIKADSISIAMSTLQGMMPSLDFFFFNPSSLCTWALYKVGQRLSILLDHTSWAPPTYDSYPHIRFVSIYGRDPSPIFFFGGGRGLVVMFIHENIKYVSHRNKRKSELTCIVNIAYVLHDWRWTSGSGTVLNDVCYLMINSVIST